MTSGGPRDLAANERTALLRVLEGAPFVGSSELAAQVPHTRVVSGLPTFLDLEVGSSAPASAAEDGPVPVRAFVEADDEYLGELLVWVEGGYLSAFEFSWVTDEPPTAMPPAERIRPVPFEWRT